MVVVVDAIAGDKPMGVGHRHVGEGRGEEQAEEGDEAERLHGWGCRVKLEKERREERGCVWRWTGIQRPALECRSKKGGCARQMKVKMMVEEEERDRLEVVPP